MRAAWSVVLGRRWLPAAVALLPLLAGSAAASLETASFRAVGVALSRYALSGMAVAPDGRLFAAVQALGPTMGTTPGTAQIRVFSAYAANDGSVLDEGTVWATVDGVRASNSEEGLLGLVLAPDFATSKLVYVYLTTTDEELNQHVRVYHETAAGTGELVGTIMTTIEPTTESAQRNGGPLAFGADGCLYVGVGDNGGANRWNAQLLRGTEAIQGSENGPFCTNVCLGTTEYPDRTVLSGGDVNHAGKVLRLDVEGATAAPAPGGPLPDQPFAFGTGLRSPVGLLVHPLTGQVYVADRGDSQQAELSIVDAGSNLGWPCLEGSVSSASGVASCLVGSTAADVYANHPDWRRPLVAHTGNPPIAGLTAYTGLGYPQDFFGDVFYLLRDSARIYRVDLTPPCFLPSGTELAPLEFHDSASDNDFRAVYDVDGDDDFDNVSLGNLIALAQGPNPLGQQVLYVAGKQNATDVTSDTVIYRVEYTTTFTPYAGSVDRVGDSCFAGVENPFQRAACVVPPPPEGPCAGQADGAPCGAASACRAAGVCLAQLCIPGAALEDGTACADGDPCNGAETCAAGVCVAGTPSVSPLSVDKLTIRGKGLVTMTGAFTPSGPIAPDTTDTMSFALSDGDASLWASTLGHPDSDAGWRRAKPGTFLYRDGRGSAGGLVLLQLRGSGPTTLRLKARSGALAGASTTALTARMVVAGQCYESALACAKKGKSLRCGS